MTQGIYVPMKQQKGPSALENAMELIKAGVDLGMTAYNAKQAFSAQPPPNFGTGGYQLNAQYNPRIKPMFTGE
jgi:hypothetical protein